MVATGVAHPERGTVGSPVAPLLAAALGRGEPDPGGRRIRLHPMDGSAGAAGTGDAVLVMASYLELDGRAVGLGAAAHTDDRAAVDVCAELVAQWAGLLRSRRLLVAAPEPDCAGARAGVETILRAARESRREVPVYVYGRPVAAVDRIARLAEAGVAFTDDLDAVPDSSVVAFPPHGVPLPVRAEAAARGLGVVDTTCPLAALAHRDVEAYAHRGDTVVLMTGARDTAGEWVSVSQAPESVLTMRNAAQASELQRFGVDPERLSLVVQTGIPVDDAAGMITALRDRYPRVRGQHYDALCYAADDRAAAVRSVAGAVDLTLVLGAADDPDAGRAGERDGDAPQGQGALPLGLVRVTRGDEAQAGGGERGGADALDDPGRDQHAGVGRQTASEAGGGEDDHAEQEHPFVAEQVTRPGGQE